MTTPHGSTFSLSHLTITTIRNHDKGQNHVSCQASHPQEIQATRPPNLYHIITRDGSRDAHQKHLGVQAPPPPAGTSPRAVRPWKRGSCNHGSMKDTRLKSAQLASKTAHASCDVCKPTTLIMHFDFKAPTSLTELDLLPNAPQHVEAIPTSAATRAPAYTTPTTTTPTFWPSCGVIVGAAPILNGVQIRPLWDIHEC